MQCGVARRYHDKPKKSIADYKLQTHSECSLGLYSRKREREKKMLSEGNHLYFDGVGCNVCAKQSEFRLEDCRAC